LSRCLDTVHPGKSDVQENEIGLQFFRFANRFQAVSGFRDDLQFWFKGKLGTEEAAELLKVIHDKNPRFRCFHIASSQMRVNQFQYLAMAEKII
jgi:hypothetical protein